MASAPRVWAFARNRSDNTGTNSNDRHIGWSRVIGVFSFGWTF
jgi:hypothetical protein